MSDFELPIDIANRALQHVGATRVTSLTADSKAASEVNFCYDKLRRAELRRNTWRFAIRKAFLRPIDTTTTLLAPLAYSAVTAYAAGAVVASGGNYWEAQATTTGETPGTGVAWEVYFGPLTIQPYDATTAYLSGELVLSGGLVYRSLVSSNVDVPPTSKWLSLGAASATLNILYPLGAGPLSQSETRNIFRLPNGFLKLAPQDPKAGSTSYLGAPGNLQYADYDLEGDYIVARTTDNMRLRFIADVTLVPAMDPMFCEGLGARVGLEVCETLTQSSDKLATIGQAYNKFMSEARIVNAIETGAVEPPLDDYLACRM